MEARIIGTTLVSTLKSSLIIISRVKVSALPWVASCTPTPSSFRIVETFSKITRLGEGIINNNELSHTAIRRTVNALRVCAGVLEEYAPIKKARYVATAACRRAKNCRYFLDMVKKETGLNIEIISNIKW